MFLKKINESFFSTLSKNERVFQISDTNPLPCNFLSNIRYNKLSLIVIVTCLLCFRYETLKRYSRFILFNVLNFKELDLNFAEL